MSLLSRARGTLALALSFSLFGLTAPAQAAPAPAVDGPLASTGYVLGSTSPSVVVRDAHALATLGVASVILKKDGSRVSRPTGEMTGLLGTAHAQGLRAELLVSNFSNRLGDFDPEIVGRLLRDPAKVRAVADRLASYVATQGWDGIQVDLEAMSRRDGRGLVQLVQELQARMAPEKTVSIAISASAAAEDYVRRGYRLAELGAAVDTLALMAYDQHGPWSGPGPIGALSWQRDAVAVVTAAVPAAKVDLGVAGYGYGWPDGRTYTAEQARRAVARDGAEARWKPGKGEWTARLSDGTRLWWSDGRSYALRTALATELGLHGVALWRLGSADPLP